MSEPTDGRPPGDPSGGAGEQPPEVGSVGDEAAKLLGALSEWARDHGTGVGDGISGLAGHAAATMADVNEHLATGSPECTYCPICRTVHAVRQTSPEVRAHLATAASSLLQAAFGLLATLPPPTSATDRGSEFERIDLDLDEGGDEA